MEIRKYLKQELLGRGGFAHCHAVEDIQTGKRYAIKIVSKANMKESTYSKLMREIKIHKSLSHQNIVKFYRDFDDDVNHYILLELCENKTLGRVLKNRKMLTELETRYYIK